MSDLTPPEGIDVAAVLKWARAMSASRCLTDDPFDKVIALIEHAYGPHRSWPARTANEPVRVSEFDEPHKIGGAS